DVTHVDGALSMARGTSKDSATSQFFICDGPQPQLDGEYAAFGRVIEGMEVVRTIAALDTTTKYGMQNWPTEDVIITGINVEEAEYQPSEILDESNDVLHWRWNSTAGVYEWVYSDISKPNIDITRISAYNDSNMLTLTMTVACSIEDDEDVWYWAWYNTTEATYYLSYSNGEGSLFGIGSNYTQFEQANVTVSDDTITGTVDLVGSGTMVTFWAWTATGYNMSDDSGEYWQDWAPNDYAPDIDEMVIAILDATGHPESNVLVPVYIFGVDSGPIQTMCFDISYNDSLIELVGVAPGDLTPVSQGWNHIMGINNRSITITTSQQTYALPNGSSGLVALLNFSVVAKPLVPEVIFTSDFMGVSQEFMITSINDDNISLLWRPVLGELFTMPMFWGEEPVENPYWVWSNATEVTSFNATHATICTTPNQLTNLTLYPFWENTTNATYNETTISLTTTPEVGANFTYYGAVYTVEYVTDDVINISIQYSNQTYYQDVNRTMTFPRSMTLTRIFENVPRQYLEQDLQAAGYVENAVTPMNISNLDISNTLFEHINATIANGVFEIVPWLRGDLDNNGIVADAVDVTMMMQASVGDIPTTADFDLDGNGLPADAVDVTMMLQASVGDLDLSA
ncbi:MAG: peptidylprolyl isomerase, partial [Candidatus Thermoplasmatota archaeon]|nr:peptidylprolyl isomerase [Candidatus Thermoplasmatota archaeon]